MDRFGKHDSIRLVKIESCSMDDKEPIKVNLFSFLLSESPNYVALSYCWGKKWPKKYVYDNDKALPITSNLFTALRNVHRVVSAKDPDEPVWLWVDQLCIDQSDVHERNHQVGLMGFIFSKAVRTIIWLGPDAGIAGAAFDLVHKLYSVIQTEHPDHKSLSHFPLKQYNETTHSSRNLPPITDPHWRFFQVLLSSPWFTRLWVFQEVVLSKQDAIILCGQRGCSWYKFSTACSWLVSNDYLGVGIVPQTAMNVNSMRDVRMTKLDWGLTALIWMTCRYFDAELPVDKIYGVLGLLRHDTSYTELVDYASSPAEAYRDVAKVTIYQQANLSILNLPLYRNKRKRGSLPYLGLRVPSWTPDLDNFSVFEPRVPVVVHDDGKKCELRFPAWYRASADVALKLANPQNPKQHTLELSGLIIDQVDYCFESGIVSSLTGQAQSHRQQDVVATDSRTRLTRVRDGARQMSSSLSATRAPLVLKIWATVLERSPKIDVNDLARIFLRVTTADIFESNRTMRDDDFADFCAYMVSSYSRYKGKFDVSAVRFHSSFDDLKQHQTGGTSTRYEMAMKTACNLRRCFISRDGNLGVGPPEMRNEDSIIVLFGGGNPFIVRSVKEQWIFVGHSYLEGAMNGESIESWRQGALKEKCFELI